MKLARVLIVFTAVILLVTVPACSGGSANYRLTTTVEGQGSVSPSSGDYAPGSTVKLTASAAEGWSFSYWGEDGSGNVSTLNVTMDSDKTIRAYFVSDSPSLPEVTSVSGYGTLMIQSNPGGADIYIDGVDIGRNTPYAGTHISIGDHSVRLVYPHYKWYTEEVTVNGGETVNLNLSLEWAPSVDVVMQPDGGDGKDASVYKWKPFENYGGDTRLNIGGNTVGTTYRTFVEFNVSSIPPTAVITDARIGLHYDWASSTADELSMSLYNVRQPWDEDDIEWDGQPSTNPLPWVIKVIPGYATDDFIYFELGCENVQQWVSGSLVNYGVMIRDYEETDADTLRKFSSSENADAYSRPKLIIQYYEPVEWVPASFAETHPEEAAYIAVHDEIQNAVTAYAAAHNGALPILYAFRTVDACANCNIIDIGALLTPNGGLLFEVPDGCYRSTVISGINDNCDGGFGLDECSTDNHYIWLVDSQGYVHSKCEGEGCASHNENGYQGVWP